MTSTARTRTEWEHLDLYVTEAWLRLANDYADTHSMTLLTSRCFIAPRWSSAPKSSCASARPISSAARSFSAPTIRAEEAAGASELVHLTGSKPEDIDVVMTVDEVDVEKQRRALDCYATYQSTIEQAGARRTSRRSTACLMSQW